MQLSTSTENQQGTDWPRSWDMSAPIARPERRPQKRERLRRTARRPHLADQDQSRRMPDLRAPRYGVRNARSRSYLALASGEPTSSPPQCAGRRLRLRHALEPKLRIEDTEPGLGVRRNGRHGVAFGP